MAEGSVRVDANISVRPTGSTGYGVRTEVKNISGVRFLAKAIDFEYARQVELLEQGQPVLQETRTFDAASGKTVRTRGKEGEVDYRYMPEPDIPPLIIASQFVLSDTLRLCGLFFFFSSASLPPGSCQIEEERTNLPELPMQTAERFIKSFGLDEEHALAIILAPGGTAYFEACMQNQSPELAVRIANWIVTELFAVLNDRGDDFLNSPVSHTHLADLTRLLHDSVISGKIAKEVYLVFLLSIEFLLYLREFPWLSLGLRTDSGRRKATSILVGSRGKSRADHRQQPNRAILRRNSCRISAACQHVSCGQDGRSWRAHRGRIAPLRLLTARFPMV
eukprot:m.466410 g.466410  ORF g.466410 m.466410 type:complete len:335 (-) comp57060_c0_seq3:30-1034(-)